MSSKEKIIFSVVGVLVYLMFVYPLSLQLLTNRTFFMFGDWMVSQVSPGRHLKVNYGQTCALPKGECVPSFFVDGPIYNGASKKFAARMDALRKSYPNVDIVCFNSGGGINREAAEIAAYISKHKISTCVGDIFIDERQTFDSANFAFTSACSSACTFILLAGVERIAIGNRFGLGLHSSRMNAFDSSKDKTSSAQLAFESAALFAPHSKVSREALGRIVEATLRTPADRMYFATPDEQEQLQFFSRRIGGSRE